MTKQKTQQWYGKFIDDVMVQKQPYYTPGFRKIDPDNVCGQILQPDGAIVNPPPVPEDPVRVAKERLSETDKDMARVVEDVIQALFDKGLLAPEDLPQKVLNKMSERSVLRARAAGGV